MAELGNRLRVAFLGAIPMSDPRYAKLATLLTSYSTKLLEGDKVLIDAFDIPPEMVVELVRAARKIGATPFVQLHQARVAREMALSATEEQIEFTASHELSRMKK